MLRLSDFCKSKELWSFGYGSMGCDDKNDWYFGGHDYEWSVWVPHNAWYFWVPYTDWRSLGSTLDSP